MFFQRMKIDHRDELNYHYMGYAEYEFGATSNGRSALAQAKINNDLASKEVKIIESFGKSRSEPVPMVVLGRKITIDGMKDALLVKVDKTSLRLEDEKVVAWMHVFGAGMTWDEVKDSAFPFMLIRPEFYKDHQSKMDVFIDRFVEQMVAHS